MQWIAKFSPIIALLLLMGCETTQTQPAHQVKYQQHQQKLADINQFNVSGKLGYIDPNQRHSLNFVWKQSPTSSQLRLSNFLGKTLLSLIIDPRGATVTDMDGKRYFDRDATLLIYQLTGMRLPIKHMQDWFKGQPTFADSYKVSDEGTLTSLTQTRGAQRWNLAYRSYQAQTDDLVLPNKMTLTQDKIKLNIVINKWKLQ